SSTDFRSSASQTIIPVPYVHGVPHHFETKIYCIVHSAMNRKITGFYTDSENHWVAELECGHGQHMRHDPPWIERPWVMTEEGRNSRLGHELNCLRCEELAKESVKKCREKLIAAYDEAGQSALRDEERWEYALNSLNSIL